MIMATLWTDKHGTAFSLNGGSVAGAVAALLLLVAGIFLAFAALRDGNARQNHAQAAVEEALPDVGERRLLVALTHEPRKLVTEGQAAVEGNDKLPFSQAAVIAAAPFSAARTAEAERRMGAGSGCSNNQSYSMATQASEKVVVVFLPRPG